MKRYRDLSILILVLLALLIPACANESGEMATPRPTAHSIPTPAASPVPEKQYYEPIDLLQYTVERHVVETGRTYQIYYHPGNALTTENPTIRVDCYPLEQTDVEPISANEIVLGLPKIGGPHDIYTNCPYRWELGKVRADSNSVLFWELKR